jgi:PAS domain S-box-containing protein
VTVGAEERYRAFIANSTEGIWRFDVEEPVSVDLPAEEQIDAFYRLGFLAEANDAFARMYGYERGDELVGARLGDLLVRDDPANEAYLRAFIAAGYRLADAESVETDRDGRVRHFSNTLTGIVEEGRLVRVWGTQRDVTAQREAAQERERLLAELAAANARQRERLSESEERFRLLVEGVKDYAIFLLDPMGNVATWNAGAEKFKGYTAHEIIGQHFSRFYTPEDIARRHPWAELEIAERDGRYEEEGWRIRKDGSRFWSHVVITALRDASGDLRGFGKVTRDVTDRRQREQERAAAHVAEQQRRFLKDVLQSVTQGRLVLGDGPDDLPAPLSPEPAGEPIRLTRRSLKALRARVSEACAVCALPREAAQDLVTAASECAMNAVQHAGGGVAQVYSDAEAGRVQVWVRDEGKGIAFSDLPRATLEPGFSTGGEGIGHGFSLMIACCHHVYLLTGAGGTTVVLEQSRQAPSPPWLRLR